MSLADLNMNVASNVVLKMHAVWWVKLLSVNFVVQSETEMEIPDILQHLWQKKKRRKDSWLGDLVIKSK